HLPRYIGQRRDRPGRGRLGHGSDGRIESGDAFRVVGQRVLHVDQTRQQPLAYLVYGEAAAGRDHDHVPLRQNDDVLAAAPVGAIGAFDVGGDPPAIAVGVFTGGLGRLGDGGRRNPIAGDDLPAVPFTLVEEQVADLCHVARVQGEIAPAVVITLRVLLP